MMGLTDVKHAGGETSMVIKTSPVTPTVATKRKARGKKAITDTDTPPPLPADDKVKKLSKPELKRN